MDLFLKQFQHLKIQLEEITSATNNFHRDNRIGVGGFGPVYRGEVSHSKGRSMVAIKRLDPRGGQGTPEFLKEITMLSNYRHDNLISLVGFCCEGREMILVYELASRGSLDRYLNSPNLSWTQRIKICLDAAKGLSYAHDPREKHQRLIHCDIKSANILLDDQFNARVSDFGLSIMGSANEQQSVVVTLAAGTEGYIDPQYRMTNTLTKESDTYSFGVVLFEVLCGTLCCTYSKGRVQQLLVPTWIESYKQKKLNDIILKSPTMQNLDQSATEIFSDIAYRCLMSSPEDRPTMAEVVTELENALETHEVAQELPKIQKLSEWKARLLFYEEITKTAEPPLNYGSEVELLKLLYKGVLLNGGQTHFSINKKGEHWETISFVDCLAFDPCKVELETEEIGFEYDPWLTELSSRFALVCATPDGKFTTRVRTQLLSPGITYTVNLVLKFSTVPEGDLLTEDDVNLARNLFQLRNPFEDGAETYGGINLAYKLKEETDYLSSSVAYKREDGWWVCELYQFTSDHRSVDLEIMFDGYHETKLYLIALESIEFRPLQKEDKKLDMRPRLDLDSDSNSDLYWEEKLPIDYEDIMKESINRLQWKTKKEAYSIFRKGFLIDSDFQKWCSLDKNGKICYMFAAIDICKNGEKLRLPESRFDEVMVYDDIKILLDIESNRVSSQTTYATYLVYKLSEGHENYNSYAPIEVTNKLDDASSPNSRYIFLADQQTPIISSKANQHTRKPSNVPRRKGLPQKRNDGWMEVHIWEFETAIAAVTNKKFMMSLELINVLHSHMHVLIEGIELRPI